MPGQGAINAARRSRHLTINVPAAGAELLPANPDRSLLVISAGPTPILVRFGTAGPAPGGIVVRADDPPLFLRLEDFGDDLTGPIFLQHLGALAVNIRVHEVERPA